MNYEVRFQGPVSPHNKRVQSFQEEPMIFLFLCGVLPRLVDAQNRLNGELGILLPGGCNLYIYLFYFALVFCWSMVSAS